MSAMAEPSRETLRSASRIRGLGGESRYLERRSTKGRTADRPPNRQGVPPPAACLQIVERGTQCSSGRRSRRLRRDNAGSARRTCVSRVCLAAREPPRPSDSDRRAREGPGTATHHAPRAGARPIGWAIGVPLAMFRFMARRIPIERVSSPPEWVADGLVHRRVWVECDRPQLPATRLLNIVAADPNVVLPTEVLQFHKTAGDRRPLVVGDRYLIRMAGPWNGPVIVTARDDNRLRLASCPGNPQQGHIDFLVQDEGGRLRVENRLALPARIARIPRAGSLSAARGTHGDPHGRPHSRDGRPAGWGQTPATDLASVRPRMLNGGLSVVPRRRLKLRILRSPRIRASMRDARVAECGRGCKRLLHGSDATMSRTLGVVGAEPCRRATAGSRHGDL